MADFDMIVRLFFFLSQTFEKFAPRLSAESYLDIDTVSDLSDWNDGFCAGEAEGLFDVELFPRFVHFVILMEYYGFVKRRRGNREGCGGYL